MATKYKVIILAAGMGSRLKPLTSLKPKCMVKVNGIPIIEYQIKAYLNAGILEEHINIVTGYKEDIIRIYLKKYYPRINIITNKDYTTTNNMFSLYLALSMIGNNSIILSNGDCVYDDRIILEFLQYDSINSIASDKNNFAEESMKIIVDNNKITHISKDITRKDAYGNSIDLYKIDISSIKMLNKIINNILNKDKTLWAELALDELFKSVEFNPYNIKSRNWMEIDNYDDLYDAERKFSFLSSIKHKKCLVLDLDGTIYLGDTPVTGTVDFIINNSNTYKFYYMTNNTSKDINNYVQKLSQLGISVKHDQIITPIAQLVKYLQMNNVNNIYLVGNEILKDYLKRNLSTIHFTHDKALCEAVVFGYDTELTYDKLKYASLLLHNDNILFLATHTDIVCPTDLGDIPDIGTTLKTIEMTTKRTPDVVFGKPNPRLLSNIFLKYNKNDIVIVGDRIYTDKILANNSKIDFILVLSGESNRDDIENLDKFPELILKDLGELIP